MQQLTFTLLCSRVSFLRVDLHKTASPITFAIFFHSFKEMLYPPLVVFESHCQLEICLQ